MPDCGATAPLQMQRGSAWVCECYLWELATSHTGGYPGRLNTCGFLPIVLCPGFMSSLRNNREQFSGVYTTGFMKGL